MKQAQNFGGRSVGRRKAKESVQQTAEGHDEWLLDEALGETFPASDAIAVSPSATLSVKPKPQHRSQVEAPVRKLAHATG
jgi:hypothetical protein